MFMQGKKKREQRFWCRSYSYLSCGLHAAHTLGQDGDVAQLKPIVHHEVVVADADGADGLQGGVLDVNGLVVQEVVECLKDCNLGLSSPF